MKLKAWMGAMRLRTLPLAASCVLTGSAMGWRESSNTWGIFGFALLTTLLLQILSNLANDYGDYSHGVDNAGRVGPQRAMQSGAISRNDMKHGLVITAALAFVSGVLLLLISFVGDGKFVETLLFLALGIAAIVAAFKYTAGKNPYGYRALGDLFVFLFFGVLGVCGTFYLHCHQWHMHTLLPAMAVGLMSCAVLNLNNMRDHVNDKASGKITLVIRMGYDNAKWYQLALISLAWAFVSIWLAHKSTNHLQYIALFPAVIQLAHLQKVFSAEDPKELDPLLKVVALSTFLFAITFFLTTVL